MNNAPLFGDSDVLPPENSIEQMARILREKMEHLDPTETGDLAWEELREWDREFYRLCIEEIMLRVELVQSCLRELADRDRIDGRIEVSK
jgi:hypothetical protein